MSYEFVIHFDCTKDLYHQGLTHRCSAASRRLSSALYVCRVGCNIQVYQISISVKATLTYQLSHKPYAPSSLADVWGFMSPDAWNVLVTVRFYNLMLKRPMDPFCICHICCKATSNFITVPFEAE
jgi:hypothetical protein